MRFFNFQTFALEYEDCRMISQMLRYIYKREMHTACDLFFNVTSETQHYLP